MEPTQQQLNEWSGADNCNQLPMLDTQTIQINKLGTSYVIPEKTETGWNEEELGESINGIIARVRVMYRHVPNPKDSSERYETSEGNNQGSDFILYHYRKNKKREAVCSGGLFYLMSRVPELKMMQVLYIFTPTVDTIYKLKVRGKSLSNLFDYYKSLGEEHIYQCITNLGIGHETHEESGNEYSTITFTKGVKCKEPQQELVYGKMSELNLALSKIDQSILKGQTGQNNQPALQIKDEEIPVIEATANDIDVRNIPFEEYEE